MTQDQDRHHHGHHHSHAHHHGHHHDHDHEPGHDGHADHAPIEDSGRPPTDYELMERAVRELLIEKGVFTAADIHRQIDDMDSRTPALGARVVARAWTDPAFKARLLENAREAVKEVGVDYNVAADLQVLENTARRHHVVTCTLCSCYPRAVLGIPPVWYKSKPYRSRMVAEPRAVLAEFGTELPDSVEVRVVDSTADLRYLVLPLRPAGTEGWSEEALADLVTRDSMIGTGLALRAEQVVR